MESILFKVVARSGGVSSSQLNEPSTSRVKTHQSRIDFITPENLEDQSKLMVDIDFVTWKNIKLNYNNTKGIQIELVTL